MFLGLGVKRLMARRAAGKAAAPAAPAVAGTGEA